MSYYQKILQPDETVFYNKKLHWIIYLHAALFTAFIWLILVMETMAGNTRPIDGSFVFFLILVSLCPAAFTWVRRETTEIVVTNKRIILKKGIIFTKTMEMNMNKVETVDVNQSILGRALNYGTLLIRGVGSSYEPLENVTDPLDLRNSIMAK